jgi:hypothetical protein
VVDEYIPDTKGVDIDVPLIRAYELSLNVLTMHVPGAMMLTA